VAAYEGRASTPTIRGGVVEKGPFDRFLEDRDDPARHGATSGEPDPIAP
jgi:hypothetical protein